MDFNSTLHHGEHLISHIGLYFLLGLVSLFTIVGNVMVILSVIIFRRLRKIPNMFIVSLASADLIMGGVVQPLGTHFAVSKEWMLGSFVCDLWTSIDVLSVTASICTLCAISLDRFVAITMPFQYSTKMTRPRARFIIAFIWILSAIIAFIPINMGWWKTNEPDDLTCYNNPACCEFRSNKTYAIVSSCVSFYIPLFVMVFAYSIVFKIAIQKRNKIVNREGVYRRASMPGSKMMLWGRGEYRAVFTMGIIMGIFCACWLPFFIVNVVQVFCSRCITPTTFLIFNWLGYTNSFFNPIIYCHSKDFRHAFKRLVLCGICKYGYQQTSRSHLSASFLYDNSTRASVRTEGSLMRTSGGMFRKSRNSRVSTESNKSKTTAFTNGVPTANQTNGRISDSGDVGRGFYGYRGGCSEYNTTCNSSNSLGTDSDASNQQLLSRANEITEAENDSEMEINTTTLASSNSSKSEEISATEFVLRPIYKQCRSQSSFSGLTPVGSRRILFKTLSHRDMLEESLHFNVCENTSESSSSTNYIESALEMNTVNEESKKDNFYDNLANSNDCLL